MSRNYEVLITNIECVYNEIPVGTTPMIDNKLTRISFVIISNESNFKSSIALNIDDVNNLSINDFKDLIVDIVTPK